MALIEFQEHEYFTGTRVREINRWSIVQVHGEWRAVGHVVRDNGILLDFIRITTTSPIKRREGRVLITESGSRYTLLDPLSGQDPEAYKMFKEIQ